MAQAQPLAPGPELAARPDFDRDIEALITLVPRWPEEIAAAAVRALESGDGGWAWPLAAALMIAVGFAGERLACWKLNALNRNILSQTSGDWKQVFGYALFRILFDLAGVLLFAVFAWLALSLAVGDEAPLRRTLTEVLLAIVTFRAIVVLVRALLSPANEGIRPIALNSEDAHAFYRWAVTFIGAYAFLAPLGQVLRNAGMDPLLGRATGIAIGVVVVGILVIFTWSNRARIGRLFASEEGASPTSPLSQTLSQTWPFLVTAWLAMLWSNWAFAIFTDDAQREASTTISWWITLLFPAVDRLIHALLKTFTGLEILKDTGFEARRDRFLNLVQTCVRILLLIVALTALAITWNFAGSSLLQTDWGQKAIWAAVDIGLTVLIAYVLYEVVMSLLDKHMPDTPEEGDEPEIEGDGGGTGATRQETLAPLLRGTFVVLLGIVVVLTVLSVLGVQILPLIAGAGILGLAIGFGSQKLVQDVISGVFFLVDDAFRRGEYIDLGDVKGTVEKISIRSMQLRHHMGALHTIPFGEIRHLTNYSRDWVMMKLKLRLTYDTDVERVRKLIKKLGQELLQDPEIGEKFLQPLKSQGVYSMEDDSAMIVRVKFMTRPGDQFMVRKTVYTRIRDLFQHEGIEFAHRMVSVRLDNADPAALTEEQKTQVAGAVLRQPSSAPG